MLFTEFKKIPRLNREVIITEKIDGTNAQVVIVNFDELNSHFAGDYQHQQEYRKTFVEQYCLAKKNNLLMFAGSRTQWITPLKDNHGFAKYVKENSEELFKLGEGHHFGEFWGSGIQRGYGLPKGEKRFSLFNVNKWSDDAVRPKCCYCVPILYQGNFDTLTIQIVLGELKQNGSHVTPFMNPEGIVIFHTASNHMYKVTIENDEKPKGQI